VTAARPGDGARPDEGVSATLSAGRYDSFVLRVFSRARDGHVVHGEVTHVSSRRTRHFTDLDSALAFIVAQMAAGAPQLEPAEHD
jgi:hypothetical protein